MSGGVSSCTGAAGPQHDDDPGEEQFALERQNGRSLTVVMAFGAVSELTGTTPTAKYSFNTAFRASGEVKSTMYWFGAAMGEGSQNTRRRSIAATVRISQASLWGRFLAESAA